MRVAWIALGVAGVVIALERGERRITATSAQDGHFSIATPPGEWHASIDRESLPDTYGTGSTDRNIVVERGTPTNISFAVTAIRSGRSACSGTSRVPRLPVMTSSRAAVSRTVRVSTPFTVVPK